MNRSLKVSEPELFRICREYYSEGIARVASVALYWSQFAEHQLRGKLGIYKTDDDLGKAIGRHPKTAGANLMKVCAPLGQSGRTDLFEVSYGPKAGQNGGRCRWLFVTPRGERIIQLAREDRAMRDEVKRSRRGRREGIHETVTPPFSGNETGRSTSAVRSDRGPQNAPTLFTEDCSVKTSSVNLSSARRREIPTENSEAGPEEEKIRRIPELWKTACERCGRSDLTWRPSEILRFEHQFLEIASSPSVNNLSDEKLLERLTFLCGHLKSLEGNMTQKFFEFNKKGLRAQSFAMYGDRLLELAEAKLSKKLKMLGDL